MTRLNVAFLRALDTNADPVSGGKLYTYAAGTTTPVTTYSDSDLTTAQAHPVPANSVGEFPEVYVPDGDYKVVVKDAEDLTLYEADAMSFFSPGRADGVSFGTIADAVSNTKLKQGQWIFITGRQFKTVPASTYTANGSTVIDLTGSGLQAVLAPGEALVDDDDFQADTRPDSHFPVGTILRTLKEGGRLEKVSSGGDRTTTGGATWKTLADTTGNAVDQFGGSIQDTINETVTRGERDVRLAAQEYSLSSTLYGYYDATNNPDFPQGDQKQGRFALRGLGGIGEKSALHNDVPHGTVLRSSVTGASAINLELNEPTFPLRDVALSGFTLFQDYAGPMISGNAVKAQLGVEDVTLKLDNSGGDGASFVNVWLAHFDRLNVYATTVDGTPAGDGSGTGTGMVLRNADAGAGMNELNGCNFLDFAGSGGLGLQIGSLPGETTAILSNTLVRSTQVLGNETGTIIGGGAIATTLLNYYNEQSGDVGLEVSGFSRATNLIGGFFSNTPATGPCVKLGNSSLTGADKETSAFNALGNAFIAIPAGGTAIDIDFITNGGIIAGNFISGSGTGVDFGTATYGLGIAYMGNDNGAATPIAGVWEKVELLMEPEQIYFGGAVQKRSGENVTATTNLDLIRSDHMRILGTTNIDAIEIPARGSREILLAGADAGTSRLIRDNQTPAAGYAKIRLDGAADATLGYRDVVRLFYDEKVGEWWQM